MKTALITGASSGIGLAYAGRMAARGYRLLLLSNQEEQQKEVAIALSQEFGVEAIPLYVNLATPQAALQVYDYCHEHQYEVDVLINNAGMFFFGPTVDVAYPKVEAMLNLHVNTPTCLCRLFGDDMRKRGSGYILNMSSITAWMPFPGLSIYAGTKSYLQRFSRAFSMEMKKYGVGVTAVCPGAVATDLYHLKPGLMNLGKRLGIIMPPDKLAEKAIRRMFRHRRKYVPSLINYLFIVIAALLPPCLVLWIDRKLNEKHINRL